MPGVTTTERPLTPAERASLSDRLDKARKASRDALLKAAISSVLVCGVLTAVTVALSRTPWWVIVLFWSALVFVFTLWIGMPWQRTMQHQVASLDEALRAGRARVTRIQSARVVQFEEEEDEGACYAFEVAPLTALFVVGQEFYEDDDFPNSDFSMVDFLGAGGQAVDTVMEKIGTRLVPDRVVPASVKRLVQIPEHMSMIEAPLDRVEDAMGRHRGTY